MSKHILVAYTTNAGTTADAAKMIGDELGRDGAQVDVRRLEEVPGLEGYSAAVVGAPLIVGWHPAARRFVHKHQAALRQIPVAYFVTGMSLTDTGERAVDGVPVCIDPGVLTPPKNPARLGFKENYARLGNYLKPMLGAARGVRPLSVGFFGGILALYNLKWWQALFVLLVIQAKPGGSHNQPFIQEWAAGLRKVF